MTYLTQALEDNTLLEVRAISPKGVISGLFDNLKDLSRWVEMADKEPVTGVYLLLNSPIPRKVTNRLVTGSTTRDADIALVTRLPFDLDPVRGKENSSYNELEDAQEVCLRLRQWLSGKGLPEPLFAMSGNGYHLQYRLHVYPDEHVKKVMNLLYKGLKLRFDLPEVKFDTTVRNPSRIFKLYGTTGRKGPHTEDRPHRKSWCEVPKDWKIVDWELIEELAYEIAPPKPVVKKSSKNFIQGKGDYNTLNVVDLFKSLGLYKRYLDENKHAVQCPWIFDHSDEDHELKTDTVIFENEGWPGFHCSHSHCEDRSIRDVITRYDVDKFCSKKYKR